jgi:hypothetical protein
MEFKMPYLLAMREQAPKMFNELAHSGGINAHLQKKSAEAHALFADLTKGDEKLPSGALRDPAREAAVTNQVMDTMIDFPWPEAGPEMKDCL